jgi:REP element-mobilizing transposase RayT
MPRHARLFGESGYEHIVVRGINRQVMFVEESDYRKYLTCLEKYGRGQSVAICAYCLMDNHVHLLLFDESAGIPLMMKKIGIAYTSYFNRKYDRTGCLLQNRYHNEPILSERQLVATFRYIMNNPAKAGICSAAEYKWSSFHEYWGKGSFVDASVAESLFGCEECFRDILDDQTIADDGSVSKKLFSDEWAVDVMRECIGTGKGVELQKYSRKDRDEALHKLKKYGLSVRQIERLTGINRGIVQRA